jgi:hypothetical protein
MQPNSSLSNWYFFGDGNTNNAGNQNAIYKLPLTPTQKILERFRQLLLVTLEFLLMVFRF